MLSVMWQLDANNLIVITLVVHKSIQFGNN